MHAIKKMRLDGVELSSEESDKDSHIMISSGQENDDDDEVDEDE